MLGDDEVAFSFMLVAMEGDFGGVEKGCMSKGLLSMRNSWWLS